MQENLHIIPHIHFVQKVDRQKQAGHNSFVLWFTGLSGSGKSTIASLVEHELFNRGVRTFILDGDHVRTGLNKDLDFSDAGRIENIRRIGEVCKLFVDAGVVVLAAFVSPFRSEREMLKKLIGEESFIEIYVDCPLDVCENRDVKGLYKKARAGLISNFTGISSLFEAPQNPDIHLYSSKESIEKSVERVLNAIEYKLNVD